MKNTESKFISDFGETSFKIFKEVAWPSGLRRWFKAPVSSEAWVRIPPLPIVFLIVEQRTYYFYIVNSFIVGNFGYPTGQQSSYRNSLSASGL